jgi:hypothetical protein
LLSGGPGCTALRQAVKGALAAGSPPSSVTPRISHACFCQHVNSQQTSQINHPATAATTVPTARMRSSSMASVRTEADPANQAVPDGQMQHVCAGQHNRTWCMCIRNGFKGRRVLTTDMTTGRRSNSGSAQTRQSAPNLPAPTQHYCAATAVVSSHQVVSHTLSHTLPVLIIDMETLSLCTTTSKTACRKNALPVIKFVALHTRCPKTPGGLSTNGPSSHATAVHGLTQPPSREPSICTQAFTAGPHGLGFRVMAHTVVCPGY